jgi:hypothetical protein
VDDLVDAMKQDKTRQGEAENQLAGVNPPITIPMGI